MNMHSHDIGDKDKAIFFHVGLPKAASTFLQRKVFPNFRNILFIKKHDFKHRNQIIPCASADRILLSRELKIHHERGMATLREMARDYPHTHPILVIRKHGSWLRSRYKYYIKKHGNRRFHEYYNLSGTGLLPTEELLLFPKIQILENRFEHAPLIFFQEELIENPEATIDLLAKNMGAEYDSMENTWVRPVNKAYSCRQLKAVRRFNEMYLYDHSDFNSRTAKFVYKKFSDLLLHTVALGSGLVPERSKEDGEDLIPEHTIREINEYFREDWEQCLKYVRKQRQLFFSSD